MPTRSAYVEGDARTFRDDEPFDAVVERLVLFHLPDAEDVVRHHVEGLRPGGIFAAIDFDVGAARSEPPIELLATLVGMDAGRVPGGARRSRRSAPGSCRC